MIVLGALLAWWIDRRWPGLCRLTWRMGEEIDSEPDAWSDALMHEMGLV